MPREPEVEQYGLALGGDHQVAGLDVAVHDAVFVRFVHGARGRLDEAHDLVHVAAGARQLALLAAFVQQGRQRLAVDVAHREVGDAVLRIGLIDLADTGMVELRGGLRLAAETR